MGAGLGRVGNKKERTAGKAAGEHAFSLSEVEAEMFLSEEER